MVFVLESVARLSYFYLHKLFYYLEASEFTYLIAMSFSKPFSKVNYLIQLFNIYELMKLGMDKSTIF